MADQPRWPRGTPVAPGGKGPGGGRFRVSGYHGRHDGRDPTTLDMVFVSPDRPGAEMYADGDSGVLYEIAYEAQSPLHIRDGHEFWRMWLESGAQEGTEGRMFHAGPDQPSDSRIFMEWVRARGYEAMILHPEAFETDDQKAWEIMAGTYGDPQSVILEPSRAVFTRIGGDWASRVSERLL